MKIESRKVASPHGEITLFTLTNQSGASVTLSTLGAGIVDVTVPDREGRMENVALAYADPADYMADGPCLGKVPGRYANRIARGYLNIDGCVHRLAVNNGPNHLHGGPDGFQNHIWEAEALEDGVRFTLVSPDGHEHYPGTVKAAATYRWNDRNELTLTLEAETDAPTVVNLTNHAYWNLDGADAGSALEHLLKMKANRWLPTDRTLIPTGELAFVADTPMDFAEAKPVGRDIEADFPALKYGKGYDNCWIIDDWAPGRMTEDAVVLRSEKSGRTLRMDTDQPGVQIYSGNWLSGSPLNRSGRSYEDYEGIAIEAQGFPDAPNRPEFPTQRVDPAHPYRRTIRYRFTAD
ncbi:MAG: galactose mutarotase [Muribaculaceae bacterium]|nr:galactose mutarotase [Muribaculaceae bacterium]